jgi:hypothetical protein
MEYRDFIDGEYLIWRDKKVRRIIQAHFFSSSFSSFIFLVSVCLFVDLLLTV